MPKQTFTGSCDRAKRVTPHDTNKLVNGSAYVFVGGAGNMKVTTMGGDTVTIDGIGAGTLLPLELAQIHSLSTTATNLIVMW
jgi:hypothetical protein